MSRSYYHISDIHIRLFSRHDEFRSVFSRLWNFLDESPKGVVVVTGDVLHNKVELTPECIILCREFFTEACVRSDAVVIIPGNHDALLNNRRRVDSLSAIFEGGMPNNLHYLRDSGIYHIGDDRFITLSVLDPQWDNPEAVATFFRTHSSEGGIALFHGGVGSYRLGNGRQTMSPIPISCFDGYDTVMLGDIHRFQFLSPRCAYAGSLISQNFSETDDDHGVLVWTPETVSLHRLKNDYAHKCVAIVLSEGGFIVGDGRCCKDERECADALVSIAPPRGRVRVMIPSLLDRTMLLNALRRNSKIGWVVIQSEEAPINMPSPREAPGDQDVDESLREYIASVVEPCLVEDTIAEAMKASKRHPPVHRFNTAWHILRIEWSNMFGYGEGNAVDLSMRPFGDVIGVFGPNSCGKSTIIDIITFILFGRITRWSHGMQIPPEVIRISKDKAVGSILLRVGRSNILIRKVMTRGRDGTVKVRQELLRDGEPIHLEDRRATDRLIREMIGTHDQFMFMSVMLQRLDRSALRDMTQKDRKEFFIQHLGLNVFDSIAESWNAELTGEVEPAISGLRARIAVLDDSASKATVWSVDQRADMKQRLDSLREERKRLCAQMDSLVISSVPGDEDIDARIATLEMDTAMAMATPQGGSVDDAIIASYDERISLILERIRPCTAFVCMKEEVIPGFPGCPCCSPQSTEGVPAELLMEWERGPNITNDPPRRDLSYASYQRSKEISQSQLGSRFEWSEWSGWGDMCSDIRRIIKDVEAQKLHMADVRSIRLNPECSVCMSNPSIEMANNIERRIKATEEDLVKLRQKDASMRERFIKIADSHSDRFIDTTALRLLIEWASVPPEKRNQWSKIESSMLCYIRAHNGLIETAASHNRLEREWLIEVHRRFEVCRENERRFLEHRCASEEAAMMMEDLAQTRLLRSDMVARKRAWERFIGYKANIRLLEELRTRKKDIDASNAARARRHQISEIICRLDSHISEAVVAWRMNEESVASLEKTEAEITQYRNQFTELQRRSAILRALIKQVFHRDGFPMFLLERRIKTLEDALHDATAEFIPDKRIRLYMQDGSVVMQMRKSDGSVMDPFLGGMEGLIVDIAIKTIFSRMSRIPSSGLLIIDENVSVLDEEHIHNLDYLFRFLSANYEHVMVMSHIPVVKDFVSLSVAIEASPDGSFVRV